ncbi:CHAT domain-containing protein [Herpetosiphon giganteus]|uniref:CHAT domain-containing protein n=1 Tax=Herpetosiphon giganteus TaxID=2029754 RepID=UPI001EF7F9BC|nr:CHAT domain-containing protein [Herpetosiphon giganteus]MBM7846665.1 tetratricopeptide (TPR) repeat protein [Herpetosiphon giganteus]
MSSAFASFHLTIAAPHGDRYPVTARTQAGHEVSEDLLLPLDDPTLIVYQTALDYHTPIDESVVIAVGQLLYQTLFQGAIAEAFATARTHADQHTVALRIHLAIDTDTRLSAAAVLPWELMATAAGRPLMLEHALVRTVPWNDPIPDLGIPPGERIRLAVTSALPTELANHPIAAEAEVEIIRAAITHSSRPIDLIEVPHLTRERLTDLLTNQRPHIVHHIGHGSIQRGMGYLDIERADQSRDRLSARQFSTILHQSGVQLVVLNACHSSSTGESLLTSFAPIFITDRIPSVIGMQAAILNRTGHCFTNAFYATLGTGGSIDASLIAARKAIHADGHAHGAWGFPTLYSRVPHGQLWQTKDADHTSHSSEPTVIQNTIESVQASHSNVLIGNQIIGNVYQHTGIPEAALKASLAALEQEKTRDRIRHAAQQSESDWLLNLRLQGFVGRVNELVAIREHIAMMRPTGGYVLITAAPGEGKSSIIAKMVQEAGIAQPPHHFIALTTGPAYQLRLLQTVVAQLILKHNLSGAFGLRDHIQLLKGEFFRLLDYLSKQGIEETIYLDGLDQLQLESDGSRDLSFLPPQPPPGIVIVLGSRPNETLKPLEIVHRVDYPLPRLSEGDAFEIWSEVQPSIADGLLHDLYRVLNGNALFVQLAANTMREQSVVDATSLIQEIKQNPSNLFGITLDQVKNRSEVRWPSIWRPMVALLVVTQESLLINVIGRFLGQPRAVIQDAVRVMGSLVSQGGDQRVDFHHLLFREYVQIHEFDVEELRDVHQRWADWCASDLNAIWTDHGDAIEQERRVYARHHYITHLALAENWPMLWHVLDEGDYGEQKTRFDPSTRLYALDLDRGRESAINAGQSVDKHIQNLPRLWKYSLLRTSLTSRLDQWPNDLFEVLAMLGHTQEALERIELLSSTDKQISCWLKTLPWCNTRQQQSVILRLNEVSRHLSSRDKIFALCAAAEATAICGQREHALAILNTALNIAYSIDSPWSHGSALCTIAEALVAQGHIDRALTLAHSIDELWLRNSALCTIAEALATQGNIDRALTLAHSMDNPEQRAKSFAAIAKATAAGGQQEHALVILDTALPIINSSDFREQRDAALCIIAEATATQRHIDRALALAQTIDDPTQRAKSFAAIAKVTATGGQQEHALAILNTSLTIAHAIDDPAQRAKSFAAIAKVTATGGQQEHALAILNTSLIIVRTIDNPEQRAKTFATITEATAIQGDIDRALALAQTIDNLEQRAKTFATITEATAIQGDIDRALALAQTIDNLEQRAKTFATIAKATAIQGDIDHALTIAQTIDNLEQRAKTFATIAKATAIQGDIDHALTIVHSIDNPEERIIGLRTITEATATQGDIDRALALAQTIDDPAQRAKTFATIAKAAAIQGDIDHALTIAHSIDELGLRNNALCTIAEALAIQGNIDHALTIVHSIDELGLRNNALCTIAEALVTQGNIDRALTIVHSIDELGQRDDAFYIIAEALATQGNIDCALTIVHSIDELGQRDNAFYIIAEALATQGNIDRALTIVHSIDELGQRDDAFCIIAYHIAIQGHIDHALVIAHSIDDPEKRIVTISTIAYHIAAQGNIDRALNIAQYIDDSWQHYSDLSIIAHAIINYGDIDRALNIIQSIVHPEQRAKAYNMILQKTQSVTDVLTIIQHAWFRSTVSKDLWVMTAILAPLLKDYSWLGTAIRKEEGWVNTQLKRLG